MAPDINSLPPSRSASSSSSQPQPRTMQSPHTMPNRHETTSPRTHSLAAAASMNATEMSGTPSNRGSPHLGHMPSDRRRSQIAMNLNLNDPALPAPGELSSSDRRNSIGQHFSAASPLSIGGRQTIATGDPHHQRQPSLGEVCVSACHLYHLVKHFH